MSYMDVAIPGMIGLLMLVWPQYLFMGSRITPDAKKDTPAAWHRFAAVAGGPFIPGHQTGEFMTVMPTKSRGRIRIFFAAFILLPAFSVRSDPKIHVRGTLTWEETRGSPDKVIIQECNSIRVYQVRILASNRHFMAYKRMKGLTARGGGDVIAEFSGEMVLNKPSSGQQHQNGGTLYVHRIISMENGNCGQ